MTFAAFVDDHGVRVATDVRKKVRTLPSTIKRPICLSLPLLCQRLVRCYSDLYCHYCEYCQISNLQCIVRDLSTSSGKNHLFVQDIRMRGFLSRLFLTWQQSPSTGDLGPVGCLLETQHQHCQSGERIIVPVTPSSKLEEQTSGNI